MECLESLETAQFLQSSVGDFCSGQMQFSKLSKHLHLFQSFICHRSKAQHEQFQLLEVLQILERRARHLRGTQVKFSESLKVLEFPQAAVGQPCCIQIEDFEVL